MKAALIALAWLSTLSWSVAEEFTPPEAYPIGRYEAGWQKNPFTLKTAPPALNRESFAKDLVLGSVTKIGDSTSVAVINTKTHARTSLHNDEVDFGGMKIRSVHLEDSRKDTYVELELGTESAVLRYDEGILKQLTAARQGQQPGRSSNDAANANVPASPGAGASPQANMTQNVDPGGKGAGSGTTNPSGPSSAINVALPMKAAPTPARRRLQTAPVPIQPR